MYPVIIENKLCRAHRHLRHVHFPTFNAVTLLVGVDNLELINYSHIVKGPKNIPYAVETLLGWTCAGKHNIQPSKTNPMNHAQVHDHPHLDEKLFSG